MPGFFMTAARDEREMRVRLPHYYIKALREFWKQGILTEAEVREKDVLVIGFFFFWAGGVATSCFRVPPLPLPPEVLGLQM